MSGTTDFKGLVTASVTEYPSLSDDTYTTQLSKVQVAAIGGLEDIGFLSRLASRTTRFQHPAVRQFMEEDTDEPTETVGAAYRDAMEALEARLSDDEKKHIGPSCGLRDVLGVVNDARGLYYKSSKKRDKVEKMAKVLNCYSGAIDAATQHHPEYTSLVWGSMKFILQVSLNYFEILSGLSTMLIEIGDNLGRFDLYLQIYPSKRMKSICSKLYAAIVGFFKDAIIFFKKSRLRRYFSAFWSPFEIKFKDAVEEIKRLQRLVETDAIAMGLMQLQLENTALAERSLALNHQVRIIIDFKNNEARILLLDLRKELFHGHEIDTTYHEDLVNLYRTTSTSDWDYWFTVERKHAPWSHQPNSTLTYMQTDLIEPQVYCRWVALGHSLAGRVPFAHLVWSPSMTAYSAMASIIIQILQQRPDLLHRESRDYYHQKFRRSATFDGLWTVFQEVLSALPGLLCYITISSIGDQEAAFAKRIIDLFETNHGCPVNLQLVTPIHPSFPKPKGFIDIDAMYDVSPEMDTPNALHHVVLAELSVPNTLAEDFKATLWQSLWRTVCYSVTAIALNQLRSAIITTINDKWGEGVRLDWLWTRNAEQRLQDYLRYCLEHLEFSIPPAVKTHLEKRLQDLIQEHIDLKSEDSISNIRTYNLPTDIDSRKNKPNDAQCRVATWGSVKNILERAPTHLFSSFLQRYLNFIPHEQLLGDIFSHDEWHQTSTQAGRRFSEEIVVAIERGLSRTAHIILYTDDCRCIT
ncbi:hypothetical protein DFP73DRAFT_594816 [Morchella snyderi]|nr:hypothetical protein DFP73DRAFT_594816 [Morchella snyderi]